MAKMKSVAERKADYARNYPKQQKEAIKIIDEMMKNGIKWNEAERTLKMAIHELNSRRSDEIMERAEDADAPNPF